MRRVFFYWCVSGPAPSTGRNQIKQQRNRGRMRVREAAADSRNVHSFSFPLSNVELLFKTKTFASLKEFYQTISFRVNFYRKFFKRMKVSAKIQIPRQFFNLKNLHQIFKK